MEKYDAVRSVVALLLVADWARNVGDEMQAIEWLETSERVGEFFGVAVQEVASEVAKMCRDAG